jgi:hypothetical protein
MVSEVERLSREVEVLKAKVGEVDALRARLDALERAVGLPVWKPSKRESELIMRRVREADGFALLCGLLLGAY